MWTRTLYRIRVPGSRVRHHRPRSSPPTMLTLSRTRVGPLLGSRFGRIHSEREPPEVLLFAEPTAATANLTRRFEGLLASNMRSPFRAGEIWLAGSTRRLCSLLVWRPLERRRSGWDGEMLWGRRRGNGTIVAAHLTDGVPRCPSRTT